MNLLQVCKKGRRVIRGIDFDSSSFDPVPMTIVDGNFIELQFGVVEDIKLFEVNLCASSLVRGGICDGRATIITDDGVNI